MKRSCLPQRIHSIEFRVTLVETEGEKLIATVSELVKLTEELKEENESVRKGYEAIMQEMQF